MRRNEDCLLREPVHNHEDCGEARTRRKMLNEIHRNGIPRLLRNRKLLESSVRLVPGRLGTLANRTRLAIVLDEVLDTGQHILSRDQLQCLIHSVMTHKNIVTISECNEESFCQNGAFGGLFPPTRILDVVVGK